MMMPLRPFLYSALALAAPLCAADEAALPPAAQTQELADAAEDVSQLPLHAAVIAGDLEACTRLIRAGADVNAPSEADPNGSAQGVGYTPLMLAAQKGDLAICKLLLGAGAAPDNCTLYECTTPLFLAAASGHTDVCRLLLEAGADAQLSTRTMFSPLMAAAAKGHAAACALLLEKGADVTEVDKWGNSALHYVIAAYAEDALSAEACSAITALLLQAGAPVNLENDEEYTPIDLAAPTGDTALLQQLLDAQVL